MNHLPLIIKREYLTKVKNKSFIIMTFVSPLIMVALIAVVAYLSQLNNDKERSISVLDETGVLSDVFVNTEHTTYTILSGTSLETAKELIKVKEDFESKQRNRAVKKIKAEVDLNPLISLYKNESSEVVFENMANYLLQPQIKMDLSNFRKFVIQNNQEDFIKSLAMRLMSLPEYQLC